MSLQSIHPSIAAIAAFWVVWAADPAWSQETATPTHVETAPIKFDLGPDGKIDTVAMNAQGNLLVGVSSAPAGRGVAPSGRAPGKPGKQTRGFGPGSERVAIQDEEGRVYAVKVVTPEGHTIATWPMTDGLATKMIHGAGDGGVYIGGNGKLARLDSKGTRTRIVDTDALTGSKAHTSGITANGKHVFVAFGSGNSLRATEDIYRFDLDLTNPRKIIEQQFGCCAHLDLDATAGDVLLVAENSRHRINRFDFDGKLLDRWGRRDRQNIAGFAACCNPVNVDFGPGGVLYTAESGVGRIKKYSPKGDYLGLVGYVDTTKYDGGSQLAAQSCYIPIEVDKDGKRIFVMDVRANIIRVLAPK